MKVLFLNCQFVLKPHGSSMVEDVASLVATCEEECVIFAKLAQVHYAYDEVYLGQDHDVIS